MESNKFAIVFCIGLLSSFLKSFMFYVTMFVIAQSPEKNGQHMSPLLAYEDRVSETGPECSRS